MKILKMLFNSNSKKIRSLRNTAVGATWYGARHVARRAACVRAAAAAAAASRIDRYQPRAPNSIKVLFYNKKNATVSLSPSHVHDGAVDDAQRHARGNVASMGNAARLSTRVIVRLVIHS